MSGAQQGLWLSLKAIAKRYWMARTLVAAARKTRSAVEGFFNAIPPLVGNYTRIKLLTSPYLNHIGHLVLEQDSFIKQQMLLPWLRRRKGVMVLPSIPVANECALEYWRRYIWVIRSPFWGRTINSLGEFLSLKLDTRQYTEAMNQTAPYVAVLRAWGDRPPLLTLTEEHERTARAKLAESGIPRDADFVCIHAREGGYSKHDDWAHSFRNCNIENYLDAVSELTARGLWCIRMGDPSMHPVGPKEMLLDYAHSPIRSDFMDVFLCAGCKLFLGSTSGLGWAAKAFGRPAAMANQAPLSVLLSWGYGDIAIPKLFWSEREGRYLTFRETLHSDVGNFRLSTLYEERGVRAVENTSADIRDLALEMLDAVQGRAIYTDEDQLLQKRFAALMRPGHYGYGGLNRVGRDFLRKYAGMMGD